MGWPCVFHYLKKAWAGAWTRFGRNSRCTGGLLGEQVWDVGILVPCVRASVKQAGATGCSFVSRCQRLWTAMEMPREGFRIGMGSVMKREGWLVSLVRCAWSLSSVLGSGYAWGRQKQATWRLAEERLHAWCLSGAACRSWVAGAGEWTSRRPSRASGCWSGLLGLKRLTCLGFKK